MREDSKTSTIRILSSPPEALRTIAVMEDNREIADFVRRQLRAFNYNVLRADSAVYCESLAHYGCRTFILDINMGAGRDAEGIEALRSLKAIDRSIFCIILTHHRDENFRREARELGCDAFLNKSGRDLITDFDQVFMALDRMWLGQATDLSFDPIHRPKADEIVLRVEELRSGTLGGSLPDLTREALLERYRALTAKELTGSIIEAERTELDRVTAELEDLERGDADEVDRRNASGRVGKLDAALDRIDEVLKQWKENQR